MRASCFARLVGPVLVGAIFLAGSVTAGGVNSPQPASSTMPATAYSGFQGRAQAPGTTSSGVGRVAASDAHEGIGPKSPQARFGKQAHRVVDKLFARAAAAFPAFCQDWEQKLKARELDNLRHVAWQHKNGWVTGTYVGYGELTSCTCKESEGQPIGEVSYKEITYSLLGRSMEAARHAVAKPIRVTNTLEIFSWDRGRWFY